MTKTLIIGGVAGGATAAARLRRLDQDMEITIYERGNYISYANCGLPYYIGDVIKEREALLLQTPEAMKSKFNIDVFVSTEVTKINPDKKTIELKRADGSSFEDSYDNLIIATGSSPLRPPIPGIEGDNILSIWTVPDTDRIRAIVDQRKPKTAAVVGGGFIGLEMAENLHARGIQVSLIESLDQVMAPIDFEMAQILHENMVESGIDLRLKDKVEAFHNKGDKTEIALSSGNNLEVDLVILSIGVRPNSQLAKDAGLALNERGGIVVDKAMRTSHKDIWAVGDVIEVDQLTTGEKTMIPLAGPANKQGRIVANNIFASQGGGALEEYKGSLGTSIAQVFDYDVAAVGLNEKALMKKGMVRDKDFHRVIIRQKAHAGYYPDATFMALKLLFAPDRTILGAQIVGQGGVDKRMDVIATAMNLGAKVDALKELELAYAPPYSSAKDPVNMLGFVAGNLLEGKVAFRTPEEAKRGFEAGDLIILDVREQEELDVWSIPGASHIPLGQLRDRAKELPRDKEIAVLCRIGVRAYNGARILMGQGFGKVSVIEGGADFYRVVTEDHSKKKTKLGQDQGPKEGPGNQAKGLSGDVKSLDCSGLQCPGPIMKVNENLKNMVPGEVLRVKATDMGFAKDVESWCSRTGNTFISSEKEGYSHIVTLQKGKDSKPGLCDLGAQASPVASQDNQGKTMIVFDGDFDKALAAFIIANGAAAMGRPVTMFFTFWGLNILRKSQYVPVKKSFIESMFGKMMPRGTGKLKLSKMNMGGMGTAMMKKVMKDKNVSSLEDLIKNAQDNGVKLIACTMSMDVMGIKEEELIDGVELAGVASYLGDAELSNVNLFI